MANNTANARRQNRSTTNARNMHASQPHSGTDKKARQFRRSLQQFKNGKLHANQGSRQNKHGKNMRGKAGASRQNQQARQILAELKKQNSFARNFALSVVKGLGHAIGATIIFGALLFWAKNKLAPQIAEFFNYMKTHVTIVQDE